jgi:hypothetical protein
MSAANDSVRVIGIGRVRNDPKVLEINFTGKPSDDDMRRVHDLLRDGSPRGDDDALWAMLVKQAHERLGVGPDPGESPFDYLQRALQRVRPYGVSAPTAQAGGATNAADGVKGGANGS